MNIKERAVIYTGIAAAIILAAGYRGPGMVAAAGETPAIRSADLKIGTCDVLAVSEKLLQSDKYTTIMTITSDTLKKTLQPMQDEIDGLRTKLQALPQESAEFKAGVASYQQKNQEFQQAQQQAQKTLTEQNVKNLGEAYNIVIASANAVGGKLGYTHVFASRPAGKAADFGRLDPLIEMLSHPLIKGTDGADITADVIKELKLDVVPAAGPTPVTPDAKPADKK